MMVEIEKKDERMRGRKNKAVAKYYKKAEEGKEQK